MIDRTKAQDSSFRLSILLAMLGMCVFLWGFGYKLSLYEAHEPSFHQIPEAKLLSRNEDPNANRVSLCITNLSKPAGLVIVAVLVGFWRGHDSRELRTHHPVETARPTGLLAFAGLTAFFFRPPPDLIRL